MKNMAWSVVVCMVAWTWSTTAWAQEEPEFIEHRSTLDVAFDGDVQVLSVGHVPYLRLLPVDWFRAGIGARAFVATGGDLRMAQVDTENMGDGSMDVDAFRADRLLTGSVNLGLYLKFSIVGRVELGLNFDLVGLPWAWSSAGEYEPVDGDPTRLDPIGTPFPSIGFTRGQVTSDNLTVGYVFADDWVGFVGWNFTGLEVETGEVPDGVRAGRYERTNSLIKLGVGHTW